MSGICVHSIHHLYHVWGLCYLNFKLNCCHILQQWKNKNKAVTETIWDWNVVILFFFFHKITYNLNNLTNWSYSNHISCFLSLWLTICWYNGPHWDCRVKKHLIVTVSGSGVQLMLFSNFHMFSVPVCALAVAFPTENGWTISHREWSFSWGDGIGQFYNS